MEQQTIAIIKLFMNGNEDLVHTTSICFSKKATFKEIREIAIKAMSNDEDQSDYEERYGTTEPTTEQSAEYGDETNGTLFIEL